MNPDDFSDRSEYPTPPAGPSMPPRRPASSVQVDLSGLSHRGNVRPSNEDHFLIVRFGRFLQSLSSNLPDDLAPPDYEVTGYGMIVADGMGGMLAGEVASRMAITHLIDLMLATPDWILAPDEDLMEEVAYRAAVRFQNVNEAVVGQAQDNPSLANMGTTLTLALNLGPDLLIAHVGDSPAYLLREGKLRKLTRDHTVAQDLVEFGQVPAGDAVAQRYRHILTRAIGVPLMGDAPEIRKVRLADGVRLVLCTDGLTDMVDDATIEAELDPMSGAFRIGDVSR